MIQVVRTIRLGELGVSLAGAPKIKALVYEFQLEDAEIIIESVVVTCVFYLAGQRISVLEGGAGQVGLLCTLGLSPPVAQRMGSHPREDVRALALWIVVAVREQTRHEADQRREVIDEIDNRLQHRL